MNILVLILLAFSCGLMDHFRGTGNVDVFYSKPVESIIYGLFVGVVFLQVWWQVLIFAVLWAVGGSFGWGEPLGSLMRGRDMSPDRYEWWQFGKLKTSPLLACMFRGAMWGACVLPVAYYNTKSAVFLPAMTVIFPLAILLSNKFKYVTDGDWGRQEFYRGWLVGLTALSLNFIERYLWV